MESVHMIVKPRSWCLAAELIKLGAVLDSESGVSYASEKIAAKLGAHFHGTQIISPMQIFSPMRKSAKAKLADGREMSFESRHRWYM